MSFAKPIFTTRGKQIELQGIEGQQIIFTKVKIGDGRITTQTPSQLTDLINVIAEAPITSLKRYDAYAAIRSVFQNLEVPEAFWWREVGLYAIDPATKEEVLYAYQNAYDTAEYITPSSLVTKKMNWTIYVDDGYNLGADVHKKMVFCSVEDLDEHNDDDTAHEAAFTAHNADKDAHAPAFAKHNADETAHEVRFSRYVKKSGDTITGALTVNGGITGNVTGNVTGNAGGNAGSATKLATGRAINGTSFNGTADITTAKWGTARNISISDAAGINQGAAVSVNGAGDATLKLPSTIAANISGKASTAETATTANTMIGTYSGNGGLKAPNHYGRSKVGALMSNQTINGNTSYKNWLYMDCYSGDDVGGTTALGLDRTAPRAFLMQSDKNRTSWNNSTELLSVYNYNSYAPTKTGGGASGTWGINVTGNSATATKLNSKGRQTAITGREEAGLHTEYVYNNGYPCSYGNVITVGGEGGGQLLLGWSGTDNAVERVFYRNRRDAINTWSPWKALAFTDDKPATAGTADTANRFAGFSKDAFVHFDNNIAVNNTWKTNSVVKVEGTLPDNMTSVYNYGVLASFASANACLQFYGAHHPSDGSNIPEVYVRSGWSTDKKPWTRVVTAANISNYKAQLSGVSYVVEAKYNSDGSWYRKYSDGWLEQGGITDTSKSCNEYGTTTLLVPFASTEYIVALVNVTIAGQSYYRYEYNKSAAVYATTTTYFNWAVCSEKKMYLKYIAYGKYR